MVNESFRGVVATINKEPGVVEVILFIAAYVGLVLAILNKCFALIHIIPDRTLRWISGHGGGEAGEMAGEGMAGAKGGVQQGGGAIQEHGKGMKGRGDQAAQVQHKRNQGEKSDTYERGQKLTDQKDNKGGGGPTVT